MRLQLVFIGNKFILNRPLREYIFRQVEQSYELPQSTLFLKDSDNTLFLQIERLFSESQNIIIFTTSRNFSTLGKVISTITEDNQVLLGEQLMPSKVIEHESRSYLLEHNDVMINVIQVDEMQKLPRLLLKSEDLSGVLHIFDEDEANISEMLIPLSITYEVSLEFTTIVEGWVLLRVESKKYGNIAKFVSFAKSLLPKKIIAAESIYDHMIDRLEANGKKISFAESCTGGLLSYHITKNNGSSKIFDGSLVTYSNTLKENWLGVSGELLASKGAVSAEVVASMSDGVRGVSSADYAIAVSGVAGDGGGSKEKPVGTVFVGLRGKEYNIELKLNLKGDRNYIQEQSVLFAIKTFLVINQEIFF